MGRELELTQLHGWFAKALRGERQLVFVTGEAGIGKTALVEAFVSQVGAIHESPLQDGRVWIGQGQCIEHFGAGEAYLPILSALSQLGRESGHEHLAEVLAQYAPTWLVQLSALVPPTELDLLLRKTAGATQERMLREMAEAIETLTAEQPLMLVLEDLHWSDPSTLELLSFIARRQQPARLLVLGSYRPMEVLTNGRPLRAVAQELALHRHCEEAPLGLLNESDIRAYLSTRFPVGEPVRPSLHSLARLIHRRTEGNPLFMVNVVDDLLAQGGWNNPEMELNMPATIRQMIERQFDHLTAEEQQVVAVASVAGMEFSTAVVAAGIEAGVPEVEMRCADLVRREHFLRASGVSEWPDGTIAARYAFRHALYQEVVYERVPAGRRVELHRRVGERLEAAYGERATEVATELAVHFERGRDIPKAVHYHGQAGQRALQRSASQEAITHLTTALELLSALPDTPERTQQELALQMALGPAVEC